MFPAWTALLMPPQKHSTSLPSSQIPFFVLFYRTSLMSTADWLHHSLQRHPHPALRGALNIDRQRTATSFCCAHAGGLVRPGEARPTEAEGPSGPNQSHRRGHATGAAHGLAIGCRCPRTSASSVARPGGVAARPRLRLVRVQTFMMNGVCRPGCSPVWPTIMRVSIAWRTPPLQDAREKKRYERKNRIHINRRRDGVPGPAPGDADGAGRGGRRK